MEGLERDAEGGGAFWKRGRGAAADIDESREPGDEGRSGSTSALAAQTYVNDSRKLVNGEKVIFSFGTIGDPSVGHGVRERRKWVESGQAGFERDLDRSGPLNFGGQVSIRAFHLLPGASRAMKPMPASDELRPPAKRVEG